MSDLKNNITMLVCRTRGWGRTGEPWSNVQLDTQEISNPLWYPEVQIPNIEPTLCLVSLKTFNILQLNLVRNLASTKALQPAIFWFSQANIPLGIAATISNPEKVDCSTEHTKSQGYNEITWLVSNKKLDIASIDSSRNPNCTINTIKLIPANLTNLTSTIMCANRTSKQYGGQKILTLDTRTRSGTLHFS